MRNPGLHLVGIAASPGGGGLFRTRAEEELRQWLEQRLDALGIDPVAYSRFVLSFLRHPDSALTPPLDASAGDINYKGTTTTANNTNVAAAANGCRSKAARARSSKLPLQGDKEQRRAVVQCLKSAADQKCGVETLVDELCAKLKDLEGGDSKGQQEESETATDAEPRVPFETLTPHDRALRYYAAFPALQPVVTTPKKLPHWYKEPNLENHDANNANNNNYYCNNNNNNNINKNNYNNRTCNSNVKKNSICKSNGKNKTRQKRNKLSMPAELPLRRENEDLAFDETMEQKHNEQEQMNAPYELQLAQLEAKFDQSLEALWDDGPGISRDTDSIWKAPSLSIFSGPSWPIKNVSDASFPSVTLEKCVLESPLYQTLQQHVEDSPLIPLDIHLFNIKDRSHDSPDIKSTSQTNLFLPDSVKDNSWYWGDLSRESPRKTGFFPVIPCKSPATADKDHRSPSINLQKLTSLPEPDEDLLTSARTHFRPIKEDGNWTDGTTFPVNNALERVAYRRSDSGNLLYLPDGESPYMEYRENLSAPIAVAVPSNLTLKFRVRQCDKGIQTEPVRSPIKRRILSEKDRLYYSLNTDGDIIHANDSDDVEKDSFDLEQTNWADQPVMLLRNERKRRHSSSFKARPLAVLRPLTL